MPKLTAGFLALLGTASLASAGDIYCNASRNVCSDIQTPGSQLVNVRGSQAPSSEPATQPAAPAAGGATQSVSPDVAAKQAQDLAAVKAERCKKATQRYDEAMNARRIYKENKDGEREYMSDEQADQLRAQAKADKDSACSSAQ
ncbi:MAG: hypothetical protein QM718_09550 [Steroidobacteraceae bacterium]